MRALNMPFRLPLRRAPSVGEELLRANRLKEAEDALVGEAAALPNDPRPLVASGHLALMRNDLPLANERLAAAVMRDLRCKQANELLAEVSYRRGDFAAAATHQESAGNRAVAAKLRSFASRQPYSIDGPETVRLPFVRTDPLPILRVRVNNGAEADFMLDTGGAEVILDASFARATGISEFGGERGYFGGGKTAKIGHAAIDSLALGELTVRNLPVQILDMGQIGTALGMPQLAGVVGTCLLYRFLATIDYPSEALVLRRRGTQAQASGGTIDVPLLMADDHFLLAEGRLNDGAPTIFLVDSGLAGGAFGCPESTLKAAGIERGSTPLVNGSGGGGKVSAWPFDVSALSVGPARREGLQGIAGVFPPKLEWAYGFRIGGLVSHGFLRAYAVTFDFDRMIIRLERGLTD
jgi:predicted aspartyl protease